MRKPAPEGSTYVCAVYGYVMEKSGGKWVRQHRLVMERKLGRKLLSDEIVHHKDEVRTNNTPGNLEVKTPSKHAADHGKGRKVTEETRQRMREVAARRCADPTHQEHLRKRAQKQHAEGNLGRATWGPESAPDPEIFRQIGLRQADRLRKLAKTVTSEEMSRRSKLRKIFKEPKV